MMEQHEQLKHNTTNPPLPTSFVGGGYGATAVAVLDSRTDMEKQAERKGVQP